MSKNGWTQIRVRDYQRDYLRDLGKLSPVEKADRDIPMPMGQVIDQLLEYFCERLEHTDMGPNFSHIAAPYCPCDPSWPDE